MKLELDRSEYLTLLTAMQIADWILHANQGEELRDTEDFRALEQKILKQAEKVGCEPLVEYDSEMERWFTSREFELTSLGLAYVEEYENDAFWEGLLQRLTERDLLRKVGEKAFNSLGPVERSRQEGPYLSMYDHEIQEHGLDRLEVVEKQRLN